MSGTMLESENEMSQYELNQRVAVITLDNPPVNALSLALRLRLDAALHAALSDTRVSAIVINGAGRCFSGGADITEFDADAMTQAPNPPALVAFIESSPKPVVAAMHGVALGGGLELAMACHARVAQSQTQIGLPEVTLGLIPGATGTQHLPRLVGLELALNMIVNGTITNAIKIKDSGLLDVVTDAPPLDEAIKLANKLAAQITQGEKPKRIRELSPTMPNAQAFLAFSRAAVQAKSRGLPAPMACVDCVEFAATLPYNEGLTREAETFAKLTVTPEFFGSRHTFLAERKANEIKSLPAGIKPRATNKIAVIGGGTMGRGIAMSLANAGLPVILLEREQAALDQGLNVIQREYERAQKKGRLTPEKAAQRLSLITGTLKYEDLSQVDLVIEAVFEDMRVKRQVFETLDKVCKQGAILASNTSMLNLDEIAAFTNRPQDVVGLHFFSPANIMKLLEIVRGEKTSPEVLATAMAFARRINKTAVVAGVCEGFIGNRMLEPYIMQAGLLLDEGALPQQIDRAMENWGMAMGPFRVSDLAGNDLHVKIREQRLANNPTLVYSKVMDTVADMGRYGQKIGRGWYDYDAGPRKPLPSAEVNDAIVAESARLGIERRKITDKEIVDRLLLALVNEGAKILDENIAQRSSDIDVIYTAGYGFPRWFGGPMFYADRRGLGDVLATMKRFSNGPAYQRCDEFWRPAELLCRLTETGQPFATFEA
jgi:3-hydroxyacyl-CoA dehydrogenase